MVLQTTSGSWAHNHQKYTNRKAWLHTATMHLPTNRIAWLCKAMDMHAQTVTCDPLSQPHSVVASLNRGLFRAITALNITTVELNRLVTMGDPGVSPRARGPPPTRGRRLLSLLCRGALHLIAYRFKKCPGRR